MRKLFDLLTQAFRRNGGKIDTVTFDKLASKHTTLFEDTDTIFELLQASGYPIVKHKDAYLLQTYFTPYTQQRFCIVDIETNGGKPSRAQVIEIGAVMVQEGEIIDRFETFVECAYLPEHITKITGIKPDDLIGAPSRSQALRNLRGFMGDAVFVAHNANFDHGFLDASFERCGLGNIGNMRLCTIDLARRTFPSERYGLAYLRETLGIDVPIHHRAYADALSAYHVMRKSFSSLPQTVVTTDDLLRFSTARHLTRGADKSPSQEREST